MGTELSPEYWYARAEETRTLADGMRHRESKVALIKIAEGYERLAKSAEEMRWKTEEMRWKKSKLNPGFAIADIATKIAEAKSGKTNREGSPGGKQG